MPRIPYAAKQLFKEMNDVAPGVVYEPTGDPDGFGVYRTVYFSGEGVSELLDAVSVDKRIVAVEDGVVEFVTTVNADTTDSFGVYSVRKILHRDYPAANDEPVDEPPPWDKDSLEQRLNSMKVAEIREEFNFESGTKKDMIAEILSNYHGD